MITGHGKIRSYLLRFGLTDNPMCPCEEEEQTTDHLIFHCKILRLSKNVKMKIYRTIILPVVLYGCETWSLTLREERKLRVFENMVLRRIFGPRRDEVTGE